MAERVVPEGQRSGPSSVAAELVTLGARPDVPVQLLRANGCPAKLTPARPWAMRLRMLP